MNIVNLAQFIVNVAYKDMRLLFIGDTREKCFSIQSGMYAYNRCTVF